MGIRGGVPSVDYRILQQILVGGFDYYGMEENYDRFVAFFGTASFSYNGKYTLNLTGRYDVRTVWGVHVTPVGCLPGMLVVHGMLWKKVS